ncbi:DinB family protein [Virgibacillus necropolis]|uniref:DinB family protein n=1 Tax=Virgibacillus necropolis TaxID=163877 RepID=UPI00384DC105
MEFKVKELEDYSPQMGHLVSMMNYARLTTLQAVQGLTTEQLDYLHSENSNSIGALLFHIAAVEFGFQLEIFDKREPNEQETLEWGAGYDLGDKGRSEIKGNSLEFYVDKLKTVRERTLKEFQKRDDNWLYSDRLWGDNQSNNYFIWFHSFEDEINHRGQIRIQRKMLPR